LGFLSTLELFLKFKVESCLNLNLREKGKGINIIKKNINNHNSVGHYF
jgi:hypothetical protein